MSSTEPAAGVGEVPAAGTVERRELLQAMTANEMRELASAHGLDGNIAGPCWGWGAIAAGLPNDGHEAVRCTRCNRATAVPLWYPDGKGSIPLCWRCGLIDHLTGCELWP